MVPVVVLVEVPDEVGTPHRIAEAAVQEPLLIGDHPSWNVSLLDGSVARCRYHAIGEINQMIRDARLLSVVPVSPRTWQHPTPGKPK